MTAVTPWREHSTGLYLHDGAACCLLSEEAMRFAAAALFAIATPFAAQAQIYGPQPPAPVPASDSALPGIARDLNDLREDIRDARRDNRLSRSDAKNLKREARQIGTLGKRYDANGLSNAERSELEFRTSALRGLVNAERGAGIPKRP